MSNLLELTAEIVKAQAQTRAISADEIQSLIAGTHAQLCELKRMEDAITDGDGQPNFATPSASRQRHHITCLECGRNFKLLSNRHLALHGLTPRDYKVKHGLPLGFALSCTALTLRRKKIARSNGSGYALEQYREQKRKALVS